MLQLTGVLDGGDTGTKVGTRYRPAGLSDPNPLARGDTIHRGFCVLNRLPEYVGSVIYRRSLEIRVAREDVSQKCHPIILVQENSPVHANEVRSLDDNLVGTIDPSSPGINVSDLSLHTDRADHASHVVDAVGKRLGVAVLPVQVLTANRDGKNPIFAMSGDGVEQSLLLSFEVVDVFGPDTDEDLGAGVEGGGDGVGEGVAIGAGVEAYGCDVLGETLQLVECGGPLGGSLA
jgi:hypothetical protein